MDPNTTAIKVKQMITVLGDGFEERLSGPDATKMLTAANNLVYLARDRGGCELIEQSSGFQLVKRYLLAAVKTRNTDMCLAMIRVLSEACKNGFSLKVLHLFGMETLIDVLGSTQDSELIVAVQYCIQTLINDLCGYEKKKKVNTEQMEKHQSELDLIMLKMFESCDQRSLSAQGRDALLELCSKNTDLNMLNWGEKVIQNNCLINLLEIAAEIVELKTESSMSLTNNTKTHVALLLEKIYSCLYHDKSREEYRSVVTMFVKSLIISGDVRSQLRGILVITTLLHGPIDVGNQCLGQEGTLELMIALAKSNDEIQQKIAAEALIAASTKKDKCASIIKSGAGILKNLYDSPNEAIKVRALVGLCKLGSIGGVDASVKPFNEDQVQQLLAACRKFIIGNSDDLEIKKWAAEGLAFLTLDGVVKEKVCYDEEIIASLIKLAKTGNLSILYGVITTFVNLTNSYDKQEVMPEMLELAKFAKQHIPENHPKDEKEFVDKRCAHLVKLNFTSALVALAKTESETTREMISRIFNAICEQQALRGIVVQQGGARTLIGLATESNTAKGKEYASHAIARIAISINPEHAFPGERTSEIVRPLVKLLDFQCSALQNFEALMALTNLAQVGSDAGSEIRYKVQSSILKDGGFSKIEHYMYEDHEFLKRAAVQCVANLIMNPQVVKYFEGENDRIKYLVALCECDDLDTAKAAAGALAMVTSVSKICCEKILNSKVWIEMMVMLCSSKEPELQHRGLYLLNNLMQIKSLCEQICSTNLLEVLMAIVRPEVDDIAPPLKQLAQQSLDKAIEYGFIKSVSH